MTLAELHVLSKRIGIKLKQQSQVLVTAESCTGGGISYAITEVSGSSEWFDRGFVTYSNDAKMNMLGVKLETLEQYQERFYRFQQGHQVLDKMDWLSLLLPFHRR